MNLIAIIENFSTKTWIIFSLISNVFLFLLSISLYVFIDKSCRKNKLQPLDHPINRSDIYLSILTVSLNCLLMLLAVYLWKQGFLNWKTHHSVITTSLETLAIIFIMDFLMYVFHYVAHTPIIYKLLHRKHHEHNSTNYLSLFVLHPFETVGFGLMMIVVFSSYSFSVYALSLYIIINLIWGTLGHLNREFFPKWADYSFLGTTKFHNQHHQYESRNFGFYTSIWDRLFGTYK
ncbi:sterol desaturase family protein [Flavobacterium sp. NKUCC04_CG]|uniref:sterol desaturase family protein n=1 Tax=Flavobacterium sp. NKUCC04_CG TaxID=2842121 RepID=UPI002102ACF7|nr:sterol desaturase family protein [Flavobacterium sp. NKUCC04_CG]